MNNKKLTLFEALILVSISLQLTALGTIVAPHQYVFLLKTIGGFGAILFLLTIACKYSKG